jgi:hypothetical protein
MSRRPEDVKPTVVTTMEMGIFRTAQYTPEISTSEIKARCKAIQGG